MSVWLCCENSLSFSHIISLKLDSKIRQPCNRVNYASEYLQGACDTITPFINGTGSEISRCIWCRYDYRLMAQVALDTNRDYHDIPNYKSNALINYDSISNQQMTITDPRCNRYSFYILSTYATWCNIHSPLVFVYIEFQWLIEISIEYGTILKSKQRRGQNLMHIIHGVVNAHKNNIERWR